ncbi:MAG: Asp-tRNA(Asn)/Glu-tRNA(Gln) amidotransferase subunit GatC [Cyanobium sp. MAG06]|nr:Asp-tRNA(Asn)/Glu-tRNA(Gln) amidotransferase subunit GatC [Cyanobium sp. MAG06]
MSEQEQDKNNTITVDTINYLQGLMKVSVSEDKKMLFAKQIGDILSYIQEIASVQIPSEDKKSTNPINNNDNRMREDIVIETNNHFISASKNSPEILGDYYKVSQVIK